MNPPGFEKYEQMASLGMPYDRIVHAIRVDGNDPSQFTYRQPALTAPAQYQRYHEMLASGIDQRAVYQKMLVDGVDPNYFTGFRSEEQQRSDKRGRQQYQ